MIHIKNIQDFLSTNTEFAWAAVLAFAFLESMVITGIFIPSIILFSVCVFLYNNDILSIYMIASLAILGAHLGDLSGYLIGKVVGPKLLDRKFFKNRQSKVEKAKKFIGRYGSYAVIYGRFIFVIRSLTPFLLGIGSLKLYKFYRADIIACLTWGSALVLLLLLGKASMFALITTMLGIITLFLIITYLLRSKQRS